MRSSSVMLYRIGFVGVVLGIWEMSVRLNILDAFFVGLPSEIIKICFQGIISGDLLYHLSITAYETLLGFVLALLSGLSLAVIFSKSQGMKAVFMPLLVALNSLPRIALAPLFILWFGFGLLSKILMVASVVFIIVFLNTLKAIEDVDKALLNHAKLCGANTLELIMHVYVPSIAVWLLTSLRASIGFSVVGAIIGEYMGSNAGIGYLIQTAQSFFRTSALLAYMILLMLFVYIIDGLLLKIEKHFSKWQFTEI